jgi:SAM-dependent methyltransferase
MFGEASHRVSLAATPPAPVVTLCNDDPMEQAGYPETWHHGLMARWWAEFKHAEPDELAYYRGAIERSGQPALDLACGVGRLLLPLVEEGYDVDGVDVSTDMLAQAERLATERGLWPSLTAQAMHRLDLPRRYRTIYICDSFAIGGGHLEALGSIRRAFAHLEPGGTLVFSHDLPCGDDEDAWRAWRPGGRRGAEPWPEGGDRRTAGDGDELELLFREESFDPFAQRWVVGVRGRRWRDGALLEQDEHRIVLTAVFAQEVLLMLEVAGFVDVEVQGRYTNEPATAEDTTVVFVAQRPH